MKDRLPDILGVVRQLESRFIEPEYLGEYEAAGIMLLAIIVLLGIAWVFLWWISDSSKLSIFIYSGRTRHCTNRCSGKYLF